MPYQWSVGDSAGTPRRVTDAYIGAAGERRRIERAYVGDSGGVPRLFYDRAGGAVDIVATTASPRWDRVTVTWIIPGGAAVDSWQVIRGGTVIATPAASARAYTDETRDPATTYTYRVVGIRGGKPAGESDPVTQTTQALSAAPMTATADSPSQITCAWQNPGGLTGYRLRGSHGGVTDNIPPGTTTSAFGGLAGGTSYNFAVDGRRGGQKWDNIGQATTTTKPPEYVQRYRELAAVRTATYNKNGLRNQNGYMYFGTYTEGGVSNQGQQQSIWVFNIPADMRDSGGCRSIDRIDLRLYGRHTFDNAGANIWLAVHHGAFQNGFPGSWPGSTNALYHHNPGDWPFRMRKPGWGGTWVSPSGWNENIGMLRNQTHNITLYEEFRVKGAQGFAVIPIGTSNSSYGYAEGNPGDAGLRPQMNVWYTTRV